MSRDAIATLARLACLALAGAALLLGGCTDVTGGAAELIRQTADLGGRGMPTPEAVAAQPYRQMYARTPAGDGVLILGNRGAGREYWYGRGQILIVTRDGQIIQTAGLAQNLEGVRADANDPFAAGLQHLTRPVAYDLVEDWSGYRYGVPVHVVMEPLALTRITVLGATRRVLHLRATVDAPAARWRAVDQYWVGVDDGIIWKSIQHVAPGMPITLVRLRPDRGTR